MSNTENFGNVNITAIEPNDPLSKRDRIRQTLILVAGASILVIIICLSGLYMYGKNISELKDLSTIILSPLITIFGTMVGFYFGSEK